MKKNYFFAFAGSLLSLSALAQAPAQRSCSSMEVLQQQLAADPSLAQRLQAIERHTESYATAGSAQRGSQAVITIPVVVHVVYKTAAQNVSDALIQNQINVLNQDFAKMNSDINKVPSVWSGLAANTNIQFCLAQKDPSGNAHTGIIRKSTTVTSFSSNDAVKKSAQGGSDAWPAGQYLNLWLCNLGGGLLGYAQFPGGAAATDGVVCLYSSVPGGTSAPFNKGRTATHEVGHWLNLRHIWGDANCGNDQVSDTPTQQTSNGGCPAFPKVTCSNGPNGDMHMNYMDYTDDACMYMFTNGQSTRMNAVLAPGGARNSLTTSTGCSTGSGTTCAVPASLSATAITASTATLNWGAASGATSYNVQWRATGTSTWSTGSVAGTSGSVSGLAASTAYEFQVASVCAGGTSAFSASGNFTTLSSGGGGTGSTATVGTGTTVGTTTSNNTPYGTYYMDQRAQYVITKAELTAGGYTAGSYLKSLAFYTGTANSLAMSGFTIKIAHTTATAYTSSSFLTGTGTTQVFSGTVTATSNGWNTHTFSTPFIYNGTSNLLVEVCFNNSTYTSNTPVRYTNTAGYTANYYRADVAASGVCANATGTRSYSRPNMQLTFGATAREAQTVTVGDAPSVSVYPNPATTDLNVAYTLTADRSDVQVEIYNQLGAVVKTIVVGAQSAGEHVLNVNLSGTDLAAGMYVCTLRDGNSLQSVRFVLSK